MITLTFTIYFVTQQSYMQWRTSIFLCCFNTDPATKNHQKEDETIDWSAVWDAHSGVLNPRCSPENSPRANGLYGSDTATNLMRGNKVNNEYDNWIIRYYEFYVVHILWWSLLRYYKYDHSRPSRLHRSNNGQPKWEETVILPQYFYRK